MRAGLLTETIEIFQEQKEIDPTGEVLIEYVKTHTIKAALKKLASAVGSGINASEIFIGNTLVFQVRRYSFISENMRIKYKDHLYKVILLAKQTDRTYMITCSKENVV